jgi:hypothetical protein
VNLAVVLCWWQEQPDWLHDAVASTRLIGASHVIAVDGAYALLQGGTSASSAAEYDAIRTGAQAARVTYTIYTPPVVWADNEREKRSWSFRLLDEYAAEHECDWFCVQDADEVFIRAPGNLHRLLADSPVDYADVLSHEQAHSRIWETGMEGAEVPQISDGHWVKPRRCLFRYSPGITVGPAHCNYKRADGTELWAEERGTPLYLTRGPNRVVMQHKTHLRPGWRGGMQERYVRARIATGAEHEKELPSWAR